MPAFLGPLQHIETGGVGFAFRRFHYGYLRDTTPLVLLPSLGGTMSEWGPKLLQLLAHRREVIIMDYIGQGLSQELQPSEAPISMQLLVDTCLAFMASLGLERPNVLGFSLGGAVALQLLAQAPERVGKIISLAGYIQGPEFVAGPPEAAQAFVQPDATVQDRSELFFPVATQLGREVAAAWVRDVDDMPPDPPDPAANARMIVASNGAFHGSPMWRLPCGGVDNTVLLMGGLLDQLVPPANQLHLQSVIPGSSLILFPHGGHGFFWQAPNKTAAYIDAFLMPDE